LRHFVISILHRRVHRFRARFFLLLACAATESVPSAFAQRGDSEMIRFDSASRVFRLDAADASYVMGINDQDQLQTLYWGKRLPAEDSFPAAQARGCCLVIRYVGKHDTTGVCRLGRRRVR
jgi:hypothetical protein